MIWSRLYGDRAVECSGLNENHPYRLICLSTWSSVGGTSWEWLEVWLSWISCVIQIRFSVSKRLLSIILCLSLPPGCNIEIGAFSCSWCYDFASPSWIHQGNQLSTCFLIFTFIFRTVSVYCSRKFNKYNLFYTPQCHGRQNHKLAETIVSIYTGYSILSIALLVPSSKVKVQLLVLNHNWTSS